MHRRSMKRLGECSRRSRIIRLIWLDENSVPSLQFGGWHTHADLWGPEPDVGSEDGGDDGWGDVFPGRVR